MFYFPQFFDLVVQALCQYPQLSSKSSVFAFRLTGVLDVQSRSVQDFLINPSGLILDESDHGRRGDTVRTTT